MSERVCVFYSVGQEYDSILRSIRSQFPNAELTALVPSAYLDTDAIAPLVDKVIRTRYTRYALHQPWRTFDLVNELRAADYDRFIVIFDSVKLRILAAMSHARACCCWALHGRIIPLETNVPHVLWDIARQIPGGWYRYLNVWFNVHFARATK